MLAAHLVGLDEVPCIVLAHLTPTQRRAYVLADNKLALNAGWDLEMLALEIGELGEARFDLNLTDAAFHYFERADNAVSAKSPSNAEGRLDSWPEGFFDQHEQNLVQLLAPKSP